MAVAAAATALVLWWPGPARTGAGELVARGGGARPTLLVYRVDASGAATPAPAQLRRADELAFGYANPGGLRYLLVFGVDEHGHVYWFHPAWPVGAPPPAAIAARPGPGPHELSEAVRHDLDGRQLRVTAVFSDEQMGVGAVERDGRALPAPPAPASGRVEVVARTFEVAP
jgi:hypothetical protein